MDSEEDNFWRIGRPWLGPMIRYCYYELTLFGDPQVAMRIPEEYEPGWVSPDGYIDSQGAWDDEPFAYDTYTGTKAGCIIDEYGWIWTPWIELTLDTPIEFSKIRFYAGYNLLHCNQIDIDWTYPGGQWYCFCDEHGTYYDTYTYPNQQWKELFYDPHGGSHEISKVRVSFHVNRWLLSPVTAYLHELQFYQA